MTRIHLMGTNACHPNDFYYELNGSQDWWLLIQTQTPAEFYINDSFISYPEHQIVLYPPYSKTVYRACGNTYQNNWIRFYTDDSRLTDADIPYGIPIQAGSPTTIHQIFQLLASECFLNNQYKNESIDHLFQLLFCKILEANKGENAHHQSQDLLNLHFDIHSNPSYPWTVPLMAKRLHLSPGYLQAMYKKAFHISCMEDVIQSRITLAKDYLVHGNYSITQIAVLCGYQNTEHFSRQFHKLIGLTPKQYQLANLKKTI